MDGIDLGIAATDEQKTEVSEQMVPLSAVQQMINDAIKRTLLELHPEEVDEVVQPGVPPPGCSGRKRTIIIDDVEGMPNFEVLGLNGHVLQIKRGVEVEVWEEYVEILRHAVSSFEPTLDDVKNGRIGIKNRTAIPWRLVR